MNRFTFLPNPLRRAIVQKTVEPYTLVGRERIRSMYDLARRIESENISGDVVECGVCNGRTAAFLGHVATRSQLGRTLWLLDSFEGMPETTAEDGERARPHIGKEVGDISKFRAVLGKVDADTARVRIVKGWFQEIFPKMDIWRIALLNMDADWYVSVSSRLDTFYERVEDGAFVSIDDYGHWSGCRRAVDEFFELGRIRPELHVVDYSARWFQKQ